MKLIHNGYKINKIEDHEFWGKAMWFSAGNNNGLSKHNDPDFCIYQIELDDSEIIERSSLFFRVNREQVYDQIERVMIIADVDEDTACDLIDQTQDPFDLDLEDAGELSWNLQGIAAAVAKIAGYKATREIDECGAAYLVNLNSVSEMKILK